MISSINRMSTYIGIHRNLGSSWMLKVPDLGLRVRARAFVERSFGHLVQEGKMYHCLNS